MLFESELKKLGLKDKEAAVYLACLQLGPSAVQPIARKAKVVRATTYVVLESLMKDGLVTKYKEGKKTLFSAEPPRQLTRLLEKEQELINDKRSELEELLPELQVLMKTSGVRPVVRYFEGREGIRAIRQEMIMYCQPGDMIYNFTPADHLTGLFPDEEDTHYPARVSRGIQSKTIFTTRSSELRKRWLSREHRPKTERRYIPPEKFPVSSGLSIYRDRIGLGTFTGNVMGVVIESEGMARMMRTIFELAWTGAGDYPENKL